MSSNLTPNHPAQEQLHTLELLVGAVSHRVKGLLTGLRGGLYMLKTGLKKQAETRIRKGWEMLEENEARIKSMIHDVLYYTKRREFDLQETDAAELLAEACRGVEPRFQRLGVALELQAGEGGGVFQGDAMALQSVLANLLYSALEACQLDQREQAHAVGARVSGDEQQVLFELSDNSAGMDSEAKEKAFSLSFSSAGSEERGLRLHIAHKLVRQHRGLIELESRPGSGTRFTVKLPRKWQPCLA